MKFIKKIQNANIKRRNENRKELAKKGKFYTANGKRINKRYSEKLVEKKYYIDTSGYKRFMDSDKLVHRWVAENYIVKRKLRPDEEVHHTNRNKLDNRIENLQVLTIRQHATKHFVSQILSGKK